MTYDYAAIGRHKIALREASGLLHKRNDLMNRAGMLCSQTGKHVLPGHFAVRVNFSALQGLIEEAKTAERELAALIDELNALSPLANEPPLEF